MPGLKLMAELGLDGSGFAAGFREAKGLIAGAGGGLKTLVIGAVGIGTVEEAMRRTVDTARELVEASQRLSIAPEQLQVLRQAAKNSNVEFEKLVETMEKLSIARERALMPGNEGFDARRAFAAMGIRDQELRGMTNQQMLIGPIRNAILGRNPEEIGIIFRELGIRAFDGLVPVLKTNFQELEDSMRSMGTIMDTQTVAKLKVLSTEFSYLTNLIAVAIGPALVNLGIAILKLVSGFKEAWVFITSFGKGKGAGEALQSTMSAMPGFGGFTEAQKRAMTSGVIEAARANAADRKVEAVEAAEKEKTKWDKFFSDLEKKFKKLAEDLSNPVAANFSEPTIAAKLPRRALVEPTDSLVKIGNFLGGNDRIINRLAERQVYWLEKIHNRLSYNSGYLTGMQFPNTGAAAAGSAIVNTNMTMGPNFPHN